MLTLFNGYIKLHLENGRVLILEVSFLSLNNIWLEGGGGGGGGGGVLFQDKIMLDN